MFQISLVVTSLIGLSSCSSFYTHSASTSQYIHSNDTIELTLSSRTPDLLHGAVDSVHQLEFILVNRFKGGHFTISQSSEDQFLGILNTRETYLQQGQQQTITVSNMRVPERQDGANIKFTLTVERDSGYMKREAPPVDERNPNFPNLGNGNRPGGGILGGANPYGDNDDNPGLFPNVPQIPNLNDPAFRSELALTIQFKVTSEPEIDDSSPWVRLSYAAEDDSDTCRFEPGSPNCDEDEWWTSYRIQDEESGLHQVQFTPTGGSSTKKDPIFFRYENFPIGTDREYEVVASASCCVEGLVMRVTDVAGNTEEVIAEWDGTGTPISDGLKWGLIGAAIAIVVILLIVLAVCFKRNYSRVPTN